MNGVGSGDIAIGYVTSGHYSLNEGKGAGLGAVSLAHIVELCRQARRYEHNRSP